MNVVEHFARRYRGLGWSVIPIAERSKLPSIPWAEYQKRPPTDLEVLTWVWPNVGVVTGSVSGIVVIDEDDLESLPADERKMTQAFLAQLPPTATAITGKGKHRYFRLPIESPPGTAIKGVESASEAVDSAAVGSDSPVSTAGQETAEAPKFEHVPTRVRFLPGLDARGEGGYALAPPSIHPSGHVYVWADGKEPEELLAELPDWAALIIRGGKEHEEPLWKESLNGVGEGKRNASAASFIGALLRNKPVEMFPYLWESAVAWNTKNDPPLSEKELRTVFDSIAKRSSAHDHAEQQPVEVQNLNAAELIDATLPAVPHTIQDFLPAGLAIIAGKPKAGKSRLAMQLALSVAAGVPPFNSLIMSAHGMKGVVNRGHVLYLALEDSTARIQSRLQSLTANVANKKFLSNIQFAVSWPTLFNGGTDALNAMIEKDPLLRLIIIDTMTAFTMDPQESRENAFKVEYRMIRPLLDIVQGKPVSILLVTHAGKDKPFGSDPFDSVVGTLGSPAVADVLMVLRDERKSRSAPRQTYLYGKGRDIDGFELPLVSRGLGWTIGKGDEDDS